MTNIVSIDKSRGFTRMDNDLYEALIGADLSGRELRVALAIHRLTAGYNQGAVKVAALYIAKMMYGSDEAAEKERANVSRTINDLIRQRVLYRDGGSRDPISFLPCNEWKLDPKRTVLKSTQSVKKTHATVLEITHIKERNTNLTANAVVAAVAPTATEVETEAKDQDSTSPDQPEASKAERIPFNRIQDLYNRICGDKLPQCLKLNDKRKANIRKCWNLDINGDKPFRKSEFWEGYFNDCLTNKHWTGENDRGWRAHLEFLTREENVLRVLEGA
ncbi:replication protein [Pseudomonas sp. GD03842]|uniref:replication protein n=1 Tax=Pseudomonas sp. GD03842 TaxID=2975385 RepID=UPI002446AC3B|nr:replication protein [Pseudomonas sp. GD03842]MDH0749501.1 replication protein [Pseudomonas sp. GD03842]